MALEGIAENDCTCPPPATSMPTPLPSREELAVSTVVSIIPPCSVGPEFAPSTRARRLRQGPAVFLAIQFYERIVESS